MKRILNVNIGSHAFTMDEDAYHLLNNYYDDVSSRLFSDERQKVMKDVETRTADIFHENISDRRSKIVDIEMVRRAIGIIGVPQTFGNRIYDRNYASQDGREPRRLYRSRTNVVIAGVCAGVANYLNVDPTVIRLILLITVLFFGSGLLIYIILWIVMPPEPLGNITSGEERRKAGHNR